MDLFISYGRNNAAAVDKLVSDLGRLGHDTWMDRDITGGQRWWDEVLENIRSRDAVVFALTPDSAASRACAAELEYADALGKSVIPVMLVETAPELAPDLVAEAQIVDYQEHNSTSAFDLTASLTALAPAPPLPDPLPPPPQAPISDLAPVREKIAAESLTGREQHELLEQLEALRDEFDQVDSLRALLIRFQHRSDLLKLVSDDLDALLTALPQKREVEPRVRTRRPLSQRDPDTLDRLRSLVTHIRAGSFTPVIGHGLNDSIIGTTHHIALAWSQSFEFPMAKHQHDALDDVAQHDARIAAEVLGLLTRGIGAEQAIAIPSSLSTGQLRSPLPVGRTRPQQFLITG